MSETTENTPQNFEQQLTDLETIVDQLESGDLPLDQALAMFEKGVKLSRQCQQLLSEAEQKVTILMNGKETDFPQDSQQENSKAAD